MKTVTNEYFNWLCDIIDDNNYIKSNRSMLGCLFLTDFEVRIPMDSNRADEGMSLRYLFAEEKGYEQSAIAYYLDTEQCTIFEMMVALSRRCEDIMSDGEVDRTPYWFWEMIKTMGLLNIWDSDSWFRIKKILDTFNNREYSPDGTGGLFYVPDYNGDLRSVEIWYQMQLYLDDKN